MHELGIASSVLDAVRAELAQRPAARARVVGLRIGELAGVDPESLRFGFDALVKDTDLDPLRLEVEYVAREQECLDCGARFHVDRYTLECPACASLRGRCIAGDELDIAYIELEEA
ncbi:MAG: hydrogenase maturation nickel metallochaperone HypA [Thermoanaerobaculia bacterium]